MVKSFYFYCGGMQIKLKLRFKAPKLVKPSKQSIRLRQSKQKQKMSGRFCRKDGGIMTAMVAVVIADVGMTTLFKAGSSKGMSSYVFLVYSYGIGALLLFLPSPFITHRSLYLYLHIFFFFLNL